MVRDLEESYRISERRACEILLVGRSTQRYQNIPDRQEVLVMRIREIAAVRVRYGYKRIHVLLRREGWPVNHKRVYRLYCQEGLNLRKKQNRKRAGGSLRVIRANAQGINDCWSMDFASDGLFDGRRFRVLSVVDIFSRECLGIDVNQGIKSQDVVALLDQIASVRGFPGSIRCYNGLSLCQRFWIDGLTKTEYLSTFPDLVSRRIMPLRSRLLAVSGMNA